ncbi:MAG: group 1 glycosyl transferase [Parcubacteria group bacterium Athens0714_16]|nr:MAG: group 1 glycosyl transferase [Parcubacteria group bacterium Athens0714_16]
MRFCYIQTVHNYAPDKCLINGLRENGHIVIELSAKGLGFKKYLLLACKFLNIKDDYDVVIIGYTLPHFVPLIRFLTFKKVIFNAVASQYEANIISRGDRKPWSLAAFKWRFLDILSFHLSSRILLESNAQIDFVHNLFFVPRKKLVQSWISVNEKIFFRDLSVKKFPNFTVLFRGRFLPESGIDTIIRAAKILEDSRVNFLIIGHGFLYRVVNNLMNELHPQNITMIQETLLYDELREKMLSCHVSLGQFADHPRLARTLPFKLYESLALGLPYLTSKSIGILQLLEDSKTCIAITPNNPAELAEKILFLKNNPKILTKIGEQGYNLYKEKLTSKKLAQEFIENCF